MEEPKSLLLQLWLRGVCW